MGDELGQFDGQITRGQLLQKGALGAAAVGLSGGLLDALSTQGAAAAPRAKPLRELAITINSGGIDTSPIYAGIERGFYRRQGVEMEPNIVTGGGPTLVAALASGQSKVSPIGTAAVYAAVASGIPLKIIGIMHGNAVAKFYSTGYVVAGPNAGVGPGEVAKLRGKKIGAPLGSDGESSLLASLKRAGLGRDDVELVNVRPPDLPTSLQRGTIDAMSFVEPWPSVALELVPGSVRVTSLSPIFGPGILTTSDDTIKSDRDLLVDFLAGTARSMQWARKNKKRGLLGVIQRSSGVPPNVSRRGLDYVNFDGRISKRTLASLAYVTIPTLISLGILKADGRLDSRKAVDSSLMKEVQGRFPKYFSDLPPIPRRFRL